MQVGILKMNENKYYQGVVRDRAGSMNIALRPVHRSHQKQPEYEIVSVVRNSIHNVVGALFDKVATETGQVFHTGFVACPGFNGDKKLYIAVFQDKTDPSVLNMVWEPKEIQSNKPLFEKDDDAATDEQPIDFGASTKGNRKAGAKPVDADIAALAPAN